MAMAAGHLYYRYGDPCFYGVCLGQPDRDESTGTMLVWLMAIIFLAGMFTGIAYELHRGKLR